MDAACSSDIVYECTLADAKPNLRSVGQRVSTFFMGGGRRDESFQNMNAGYNGGGGGGSFQFTPDMPRSQPKMQQQNSGKMKQGMSPGVRRSSGFHGTPQLWFALFAFLTVILAGGLTAGLLIDANMKFQSKFIQQQANANAGLNTTDIPTTTPTLEPTFAPTFAPTNAPTRFPTAAPTHAPTNSG